MSLVVLASERCRRFGRIAVCVAVATIVHSCIDNWVPNLPEAPIDPVKWENYPEHEFEYAGPYLPLPDVPIPTDIGSFVLIKGGTFTMGAPPESKKVWKGDASLRRTLAQPQHAETIGDFLIGKYLVTATEYCEFLNEQRRAGQSTVTFLQFGEICSIARSNGGDYKPKPGYEWSEVGPVSYEGAQAYCRWVSGRDGRTYRLPTEVEWEYVARGSEGRLYPWGNENPLGRAFLADVYRNSWEEGALTATYVGRFPKGATPDGVHDMICERWEMCQNAFHPYTTESITADAERWAKYVSGTWQPASHQHRRFGGTSGPAMRGGGYLVTRGPYIVANAWSRSPGPPMIGGQWVYEGGAFRLLCEDVSAAPELTSRKTAMPSDAVPREVSMDIPQQEQVPK
ncbi:MAG: SUMF1/EgtB/PvdO family nonheme iron enzyme [Candidatus Hydrogenedentes bacterium]|nr:SUMF1/EgtB/PvdO family nonheme iron enzyme [Candidatus Hydrogenedentota bacterium]